MSDTDDQNPPEGESTQPVHLDDFANEPGKVLDHNGEPAGQSASADPASNAALTEDDDPNAANARDLEAVFDVPVRLSAILGRSRLQVSDLINLDVGTVLELDRKVGEAIDICVNDRLVARGEVVLVDEKLGITMTEIIKSDR